MHRFFCHNVYFFNTQLNRTHINYLRGKETNNICTKFSLEKISKVSNTKTIEPKQFLTRSFTIFHRLRRLDYIIPLSFSTFSPFFSYNISPSLHAWWNKISFVYQAEHACARVIETYRIKTDAILIIYQTANTQNNTGTFPKSLFIRNSEKSSIQNILYTKICTDTRKNSANFPY